MIAEHETVSKLQKPQEVRIEEQSEPSDLHVVLDHQSQELLADVVIRT